MNTINKIRIMLVDDHVLMRMGLVSATQIEPDMTVACEVEDGKDAIAAYRQHRPDVVIMDLRMPGIDGIEVINNLRSQFGNLRILVLSNYAAGDDVARAIQAGASGFVSKDMPLEILLEGIRSVNAGKQYLPREIASSLAERIRSQLSSRELDVLRLIAKGFSNKEAASKIGVVEATVKAHLTNIFQKLGVADRTQAITIAMKRRILQLD
jgi:DNA-binding NarL/FixJ family response regulator